MNLCPLPEITGADLCQHAGEKTPAGRMFEREKGRPRLPGHKKSGPPKSADMAEELARRDGRHLEGRNVRLVIVAIARV